MADTKISALPAATLPLAGTEVLPVVQSGATVKVANNDLRPKQIQSNATSGVLQIAGPGAGTTKVMTVPNADFTAARTDSGQTFTGVQTFSFNTTDYTAKIYNTLNQTTGHGLYVETRWNVAGNYIARFATNSGSTNVFTIEGNNNVTFDTGNLVQGTAAKGINFTANSAAAGMTSQLLNWYEEGTWTPDLLIAGGNTGITYTSRSGRYTRIGRMVEIECSVVLSSKGARTGAVRIGGLPYTLAIDALPATIVPTGTWALLLAGGGVQAYISGTAVYLLLGTTTGTTALTDTNLSNTSAFTFTATFTV